MESDLNTPVFNDSANEKTSADAIPFEQAMQVFDQLADRTDIAFAYAEDGCYARAHLMCLIINALGLTPKKAWAFEDRDYLSVQKPNGEKVIWGWHVTAALPVKMPDGAVQDMVFDPGLFDGPVSLQEWGSIMGAKSSQLQIAAWGVPPSGYDGDYHPYRSKPLLEAYRSALGTMSDYLQYQDAGARTVFQSQSRQQFSQTQGGSNPPKGKTWQSVPIATQSAAIATAPATGTGLMDRALNWFSFSHG